jgi:outer membrane protein OmpA-like peptidoglycan-associated protein
MRFLMRRSGWWLTVLLLSYLLPGRVAAQDDFEDAFDDFDELEEPVEQMPVDEEPAEAAEQAAEATPLESDEQREQRFRLHGTVDGLTGGVWTVDAGSAPAGTFRTQLALDFFVADGYLEPEDNNDYLGGALSVSWSALDFLEVYASITSSANANDKEQPELFQVLGDTTLGGKAFYPINPWLTLGGDLRLVLLNSVGGIGPKMKGTSIGIRGNASADFRRVEGDLPLIVRFNLDYFFDNSANVVEDIEQQRFESLSDPDFQDPALEYHHLLSRVERFALGINRVDLVSLALGFEAPLTAATDFHIHPLLEWSLGIPANRQGYSCLFEEEDVAFGGDSCLERAGAGAFPQTLTLGFRVYPPLRGVALLASLDLGLTGTRDFVRELAPTKPYDVIFALSFAYDARSAGRPAVREEKAVRGVLPYKGRIRGQVVEEGTDTAVAGALVTYPGRELTAQQADGEGRFLSYELGPGEVEMEISHPDYETIPHYTDSGVKKRAGGSLSMEDFTVELAPYPTEETGEEPEDSASDSSPEPSREVSVTCALRPQPRKAALEGTVTASSGLPLGGASLELLGPEPATTVSQPSGDFAFEVAPGSYTLRAEAEGCFIKQQAVELVAGETAPVQLVLLEKPKRSLVSVTARAIRLRRKIAFRPGSAEIDAASDVLLAEIADVMARQPEIGLVEIGVHTDNRGSAARNLEISQQRAEAVRDRLVESGVSPARLEAKGYGAERPLVPNLTSANRARNRRVELRIKQ